MPTLTKAQWRTAKLALVHWVARCEQEAATMERWAQELPADAVQCLKNAEASRRMAEDAQSLLNEI